MGHLLPYAANCSLLFTEVGLLERPAAARAAGFDAIEFWWPWPDQPMPPDAEIDKFIAAVHDAGVQRGVGNDRRDDDERQHRHGSGH